VLASSPVAPPSPLPLRTDEHKEIESTNEQGENEQREIVICENRCIEKKESVFLSLSGGKHFPLIKRCFFVDWN
jgi:hypothetical protein